MWFRNVPPNGEYLKFWIHTDMDAGTIHLLPFRNQNDEQPYAWPYKRDRNGNWVWGPVAIDLIDFMVEAERDGRGPDWCNRIRQGLMKLEGEQETRKYSLSELKREDPKLHAEIKTAMAELKKRYQTPTAAPESDAEPRDGGIGPSGPTIASEALSGPLNDEWQDDDGDVPF